jgi:hypothetical protein
MDVWFRFLKSLESEGGSIVVLVVLIGIVAGLHFLGFRDADSQITFVLGALVGLLKGRIEKEKEH